MNAPSQDADLALAVRMADAAGRVARRYFRTPVAVDDKADDSPVTVADREAESAMRALLAQAAPRDGILGEEYGSESPDARRVWVLDPIDGTRAFITGKPSFVTLIALVEDGRPALGVIDQPVTGERWIGRRGHPTTLNGKPVRTRSCARIDRAVLYSTDPYLFAGDAIRRFERLRRAVKMTRFGADGYAYGLLAAGFVDLVCESDLKPYDWAALVPVIEGAGGRVTDWEGRPLDVRVENGPDHRGRVCAAGDPACHAQALALLSAADGVGP